MSSCSQARSRTPASAPPLAAPSAAKRETHATLDRTLVYLGVAVLVLLALGTSSQPLALAFWEAALLQLALEVKGNLHARRV